MKNHVALNSIVKNMHRYTAVHNSGQTISTPTEYGECVTYNQIIHLPPVVTRPQHWAAQPLAGAEQAPDGSLLMATKSMQSQFPGICVYYNTGNPVTVLQDNILLDVGSPQLARWVAYCSRTPQWAEQAKYYALSSTTYQLWPEQLVKIRIPIPEELEEYL